MVPSSDDSGKNVTLYECREVYNGPIAYAVEVGYGNSLQEGLGYGV